MDKYVFIEYVVLYSVSGDVKVYKTSDLDTVRLLATTQDVDILAVIPWRHS